MATTTFDPSEDRSDEQKAAEAAALEQGEKIAQMQEEDRARKYEQSEAEEQSPDLIGGKFKSQDELLKAYEELQRKMSSGETESSEEGGEAPVEEAPEEEPEEEVEETGVVADAAKYMHSLSEEVSKTGQLSEEAIERFSSMDTKDLIAAYMQYNAQATQAQMAGSELQAIRDSVGGDQAYTEMVTWAAQNLSESEINDFNAVTNSNEPAAIRFAVGSLHARYKENVGYEAPLVTGRKAADGGKAFRSHAELSRAIADPRYATDPAYRQDVEARLARSTDLL